METETPEEDGWASTFVKLPPPTPTLPSEGYRALRRLGPEGWEKVAPAPAADLLKHAERFGTECVAETAAETFGEEALTSLIARLDVIDLRRAETADARFRFKTKRPRVKPADVRARALLGIPEEEIE